jgi:hypothetical protein
MNLEKIYVKLTSASNKGNVYLSPDIKPQALVESVYKSSSESEGVPVVSIYFPGNMHMVTETIEQIVEQYEKKRTKAVSNYFSKDVFGEIEEGAYNMSSKGTRPTKTIIGQTKFQELIDGIIPKEEQTGQEYEHISGVALITRFGVLLLEESKEATELKVS